MYNLHVARQMVEHAIRARIVPMLWGGPGIGKSSLIWQIANDFNLWVNDIRLAQRDPTDIKGLPSTNHETKLTEWYPPSDLPVRKPDGKCDKGPGIVFFDEIDKAPTLVKNAALQIILDRKTGDYVLPDDVAMVCAGNREDDNTFSSPLGAALANRMIHIEIKHDIDVFTSWAYKNNIAGDIIGFLLFKPGLLYDNTGHNAFPSPRSWSAASKLIDGITDERMIQMLIGAAVGEATAQEFLVWSKIYRDVDCEAVITKGILPKLSSEDPSFNYAVTMAVAMYTRKKGVKKHKDNIAKFIDAIAPELRVVFLRQQTQHTMNEFVNDQRFSHIIKDIMSSFNEF